MDAKTGKFVVFGFLALLVAAGADHCSNVANREAAIKREADQLAAAEAKKRDEAAAALAKIKSEFSANKATIVSDLQAKVSAKDWSAARAAAIPFKDVTDPDYIELAARIFDGWNAQESKRKEAEKAAAVKADLAKRKKEGVRIGMTQDEVIKSSWGKPQKINRTTGSYGVHEQWVYGGNDYLYFENGILRTVQN